ncbi:hypothetical protein D3C77_731580 [compost metagenome]
MPALRPNLYGSLMMRTATPTGAIFDSSSTLLLNMRKQPWLVRMPIPNFLFEP